MSGAGVHVLLVTFDMTVVKTPLREQGVKRVSETRVSETRVELESNKSHAASDAICDLDTD